MAKKNKTVKANTPKTPNKAKGLQEQLATIGSKATFESLEQTARQNFLEVRSRAFRGVDILVKQNRDLLDCGFVLEVDSDGKPTPESHAKLQNQAQLLMQANFKPKSEPKPDLGWGEARWSVSDAARKAGLDPTVGFEVGFTVARHPNQDRAARMAELVESSFEIDGISLTPNQAGDHLDIPAGAMLGHQGLVLVKRGGHTLELTSFMNALLKTGVKQWAKPTQVEKEELARKAKAEAKANAKAKAAADAYSIFEQVMAEAEAERLEAERLEAERLEAERQARLKAEWVDVVNARPDLVAAWAKALDEDKDAYDKVEPVITMLLGIVRPGIPSKEAVAKLCVEFSSEVYQEVGNWVKNTANLRDGLGLSDCASMFIEFASDREQLEDLWYIFEWFMEDGNQKEELRQLDSYSTRETWIEVVTYSPGLSTETIRKLKELADSEISS